MITEVVEKSRLGREISFDVEKEILDRERVSIIKEIKNSAVIEGFRKGKAPDSIIETKYQDTIRENLLKRIIPKIYLDALKQKGFSPVVEPDIYGVNFDNGVLKFKVYIELKPDVNLPGYKGISVKRRTPEPVTEKDIDKTLAEWEKKPELVSSIIDPVKRKAWREKIKKQMEDYNAMKAHMEEDKELWREIFKNTDFPVPEKMVNEQALRYTEDYLNRMDFVKNKTQEEKEKLAKEVFEKVKPEAETNVKKYFVLDKIAETEKVEVSEEDVKEKVTELSRSVGESYEQVKEKIENSGKMHEIKDEIRIQKAFKILTDNVQSIKRVILPGEEKRLETIR
jgi:FKBP-type peptidyl-prolyl cis-trans isomerase (trigger factor)